MCGIVGMVDFKTGQVPPRLLDDGDVVECEIAGWPGCRNVVRIPAQRGGAR